MYHADASAQTDHRSANALLVLPSDWTRELLPSFTFLMAGHGVPVCASMMLGDSAYAREQLRLACTLVDRDLQHIAVEMLGGLRRCGGLPVDGARWSH